MKRTDAIYKSLSSERYTPYSLARKIGAKVILESASFAKGRERYSILMAEEAFKILQDEDGVAFLVDGNRIPFDTTNIESFDALGRKKMRTFWMHFCTLRNKIKRQQAELNQKFQFLRVVWVI